MERKGARRVKVAVFGTGAIGGYIGGLLALDGHEVHLIARGAHLDAIRERGLTLREVTDGETTEERIVRAPATNDPAEIGPTDLVLFGVKAFDTDEAGAACAPLVGPDTAVLTIQNGLDAPYRLAARYGAGRVLAGSTGYTATITAPGIIARFPPTNNLEFAELHGPPTERTRRVADALTRSGTAAVPQADAKRVLYAKFLFLGPTAALTAASRATYGEVFSHLETCALYDALVDEVAAVGRAEGTDLPPEMIAARKAFVRRLSSTDFKSSLQRDFERGRRTELDDLLGAVVARGKRYGVGTPHFDTLHALLSLARARGYRYSGDD